MSEKIAVIGAGSWGLALAILLNKSGHKVDLWTRSSQEADAINREREQKDYLPGAMIPKDIGCFTDIEKALHKKEVVVLAVPSQAIRGIVKDISGLVNENHILVSVAKGIEETSLMRMSEVIESEASKPKIAVLSGPSHAEEVSRSIPTTVVSSSLDAVVAKKVQDIFMTNTFRVYTNSDLIGVELGGALKNVIALSAGITDGLGFGDNTKAALMTRGLTEIARLGQALGAKKQTFAGLSGMGDLIVTCTSMHSRNRRAGILIGQGKSLEEALKEVKMVVEGVITTKGAYKLSKQYNVEMPIVEQAYKTLFEQKDPKQAVKDLMDRGKKPEIEETFAD
jgi:glycerol-3-phosphate dehydrogenase (NAD(P)+)